MRDELAAVVSASAPHASFVVGAERWDLYISGVRRVDRDMFLQLALVGPRICTVTVRAPAPIGNTATARRVLGVVQDWLRTHDRADQAYLELSTATELAS
jgi:hypothetical protein